MKLTKPKLKPTPERLILKAIMNYLDILERQGKLYYIRSNSGAVRLQNGAFMKTGKVGCADIICLYKGKFIAIEVKNEKGKQTPEQKMTGEIIDKLGGIYFVARSIDDVIRMLEQL
jgi:hypothetical protein